MSGLPWKESLSIGLLMNTRALMALVVINIGADMGIISPAAFFWLVTMALFTTVITTPILRRLYPAPEAAGDWGEAPVGIGPGAIASRANHDAALDVGRSEEWVCLRVLARLCGGGALRPGAVAALGAETGVDHPGGGRERRAAAHLSRARVHSGGARAA